MARALGAVGFALVVLLAVGVIVVYQQLHTLESERVSQDVHVIRGPGPRGNVAVLGTDAGCVVVDSMTFRFQGKQLHELAARLAGGPVQLLINTHYHQDHTHGNPGFAPGTRVVATRRTLDHLMRFDAGYWRGGSAETLPNDLVEDAGSHELLVGGKTIARTTWVAGTRTAISWCSSSKIAWCTWATCSSTDAIPGSTAPGEAPSPAGSRRSTARSSCPSIA